MLLSSLALFLATILTREQLLDLIKPKKEVVIRTLSEDEKQQFPGFYWVTLGWARVTLDDKQQILVPPGFIMDGASGPGIDSWGIQGWVPHDWMYSWHLDINGGPIEKWQADRILNEGDWLLSYRILAVWLFGKKAWDGSGHRGPIFLTPEDKRLWEIISAALANNITRTYTTLIE